MSVAVPHNSIFISVDNGLTGNQEGFVAAIEALLVAHDLQPITLGRNVQSAENPLAIVRAIVSATLGTLVIAFPRLRVLSALEYPESTAPRSLPPRDTPTVWNQVEASMTYQAGHPLLILVHERLYEEGIIDPAVHPCLRFALTQSPASLPPELRLALENWLSALHPGG